MSFEDFERYWTSIAPEDDEAEWIVSMVHRIVEPYFRADDAAGQTLAPTSAPAHLAVISLAPVRRAQKSLRHTAEDAAAVFQYRGQNPFFRAEIERHSQAGSRGAGAASRRRPVRNVSALGRTGHALGDGGRR